MGITIRNNGQGGRITFRSLGLGGHITSGWPVTSTGLLLDTYNGAAAAYSLRKLNTSYSGSAVRVRRSSDNTEQDIGFVNGVLDTATLLSFCGAGNGFVTTWYDQSGNAKNTTQTTAGNQPRIVNTGIVEVENSVPTIRFIRASTTSLSNSSIITTSSNSRLIASIQKVITYASYSTIWSNASANNFSFSAGALGSLNLYMYNGSSTTSYPLYAKSELFLNSLSNTKGYINSQYSINFTDSKAFTGIRLGNITGGALTDSLDGTISEFIFYDSGKSSVINNIENNMSVFYQLKPANSWVGTGTALLDLYPGASFAYSLRNLSSTYIGALIRVRRSSDNTEKDIFGLLNGNLDTATLLSFVGSGDGFVSAWYDQTQNGGHQIQTTTANQPTIVTSGVYLGYLLFDGVNDMLTSSPTNILWNGSTGATITTVSAPDSSTPNGAYDTAPTIQIPESGSWGTIYQTVGPTFIKWRFGTGVSLNDETYTKSSGTTFCLVNTNKNSTTETLYLNNNLVKTSTGKGSTLAGNSATTINIAKSIQTGYWKGFQKESIGYNTTQLSNLSGINSNINTYYSIY